MGIFSIILIILLLLGGFMGYKAKVIKEFKNVLLILLVAIISIKLKKLLLGVVIKFVPFLPFKGYENFLISNVMFYSAVCFVVSFVFLYCVFGILLDIAKVNKLLNKISIMEVPSRVMGVILGMIENLFYFVVLAFVALQVPFFQKTIMNDSVTRTVIERTPILSNMFIYDIAASENTYYIVTESNGEYSTDNLSIMSGYVKWGIINKPDMQVVIDTKGIGLEGVQVF